MEWRRKEEREACATLSISKRGEGEELSPEPKTSGGFHKISFPNMTTALISALFDKNTFVRHTFIEAFCKNIDNVWPNLMKPSAVFCSQPLSPKHAVSQAVLGSCPKKEREEAPNGWTSGKRRMGLGKGGGGGGTEFWATHN